MALLNCKPIVNDITDRDTMRQFIFEFDDRVEDDDEDADDKKGDRDDDDKDDDDTDDDDDEIK